MATQPAGEHFPENVSNNPQQKDGGNKGEPHHQAAGGIDLLLDATNSTDALGQLAHQPAAAAASPNTKASRENPTQAQPEPPTVYTNSKHSAAPTPVPGFDAAFDRSPARRFLGKLDARTHAAQAKNHAKLETNKPPKSTSRRVDIPESVLNSKFGPIIKSFAYTYYSPWLKTRERSHLWIPNPKLPSKFLHGEEFGSLLGEQTTQAIGVTALRGGAYEKPDPTRSPEENRANAEKSGTRLLQRAKAMLEEQKPADPMLWLENPDDTAALHLVLDEQSFILVSDVATGRVTPFRLKDFGQNTDALEDAIHRLQLKGAVDPLAADEIAAHAGLDPLVKAYVLIDELDSLSALRHCPPESAAKVIGPLPFDKRVDICLALLGSTAEVIQHLDECCSLKMGIIPEDRTAIMDEALAALKALGIRENEIDFARGLIAGGCVSKFVLPEDELAVQKERERELMEKPGTRKPAFSREYLHMLKRSRTYNDLPSSAVKPAESALTPGNPHTGNVNTGRAETAGNKTQPRERRHLGGLPVSRVG